MHANNHSTTVRSPLQALANKLGVRPGEFATLALSFCYFLLLLASYFILRPIRDGLAAGINQEIKYLSIAVLLAMLAITPVFGRLMTRIPRHRLLPRIYIFSALNLLVFAALFAMPSWALWSARLFYVWTTIFNLFVVSVFWSFMADIWNAEQSRRLFGVIAAGGSLGGLLGPTVAKTFAATLGNSGLALSSAALLIAASGCLLALTRAAAPQTSPIDAPTAAFGGSSFQGIALVLRSKFLLGIAGLLIVNMTVGMFAYLEIGQLAKSTFATSDARTAFYAGLDFWTNAVTLVIQAFVVGLLSTRWGVQAPLFALSIIGCVSFIPVMLSPVLGSLAITNVIRRAAEFGLGKPGRDMLYTVATPQEKYLAKNVIDTVIYRATDVCGGWLHAGLAAIGVTLAGFGWISAVAMGSTVLVVLAVVKGYRQRVQETKSASS